MFSLSLSHTHTHTHTHTQSLPTQIPHILIKETTVRAATINPPRGIESALDRASKKEI